MRPSALSIGKWKSSWTLLIKHLSKHFFLTKKNRWDHLLLTSMLLLDNFSFNVFEARASQRFLVILFFSGVYKMFYACKTKKKQIDLNQLWNNYVKLTYKVLNYTIVSCKFQIDLFLYNDPNLTILFNILI